MRTLFAFSSFIILAACFASPADAGEANVVGVDRYAAPGDTLRIAVELVNDSERRARFRVVARVKADKALAKGKAKKAKGKRKKLKFRLEPGESVVRELALPVPKKADGPILVECKVRWPNGRDKIVEEGFAFRGDEGEGDKPPDDGELPPKEILELEGTLFLTVHEPPKPDDEREKEAPENAIWMPRQLTLVTDERDEWLLFGHEADFLAWLMAEADLTETRAVVAGVPMDVIPGGPGTDPEGPPPPRPEGPPPGTEHRLTVEGKILFLLEWKAEGVTDPRAGIVPHRYVLDGPLSQIDDPLESVVQTESDWERLLDLAGIVLPERPDDPVWPPDPDDGERPPGVFQEGENEGEPKPPEFWLPWEVDFEKETVLAVFAGEQPTTGHRVVILKVTEEEESLVVAYALIEPSKHEIVVEVPTQPFAIAAIPRTEARIVFEKVDYLPDDPGFPKPFFDER